MWPPMETPKKKLLALALVVLVVALYCKRIPSDLPQPRAQPPRTPATTPLLLGDEELNLVISQHSITIVEFLARGVASGEEGTVSSTFGEAASTFRDYIPTAKGHVAFARYEITPTPKQAPWQSFMLFMRGVPHPLPFAKIDDSHHFVVEIVEAATMGRVFEEQDTLTSFIKEAKTSVPKQARRDMQFSLCIALAKVFTDEPRAAAACADEILRCVVDGGGCQGGHFDPAKQEMLSGVMQHLGIIDGRLAGTNMPWSAVKEALTHGDSPSEPIAQSLRVLNRRHPDYSKFACTLFLLLGKEKEEKAVTGACFRSLQYELSQSSFYGRARQGQLHLQLATCYAALGTQARAQDHLNAHSSLNSETGPYVGKGPSGPVDLLRDVWFPLLDLEFDVSPQFLSLIAGLLGGETPPRSSPPGAAPAGVMALPSGFNLDVCDIPRVLEGDLPLERKHGMITTPHVVVAATTSGSHLLRLQTSLAAIQQEFEDELVPTRKVDVWYGAEAGVAYSIPFASFWLEQEKGFGVDNSSAAHYFFGDASDQKTHVRTRWETLVEDNYGSDGGAARFLPLTPAGVQRPLESAFGVGGAGTGVPFHSHHAFVAEALHGRKLWLLYDPQYTPPDMRALESSLQWLNRVWSTCISRSPGVEKTTRQCVRPLQCTLKAGELLVVSRSWWHSTLNVDPFNAYLSVFRNDVDF